MKEIWKDIKGYEDYYQVSNKGNVKSLDRKVNSGLKNNMIVIKYGKVLSKSKDRNGYFIVSLSKTNIKKSYKVSVLVAKTFIKNPNNKPQVNHINGVKSDDSIKNLEWCTNKENIQHAFKTGLCSNEYKKVKIIQMDLEGNFIKLWDSISEAEEKYNASHIIDCCKNRRNKCKGYRWIYYEDII